MEDKKECGKFEEEYTNDWKSCLKILNDNKKGAYVDWIKIVHKLRTDVSSYDEKQLEEKKWMAIVYKKNSSIDKHNYVDTIIIAVIAILLGVASQFLSAALENNVQCAIAMTLIFAAIIIVLVIKLSMDFAKTNLEDQYLDIYCRVIEEEINNKKEKRKAEIELENQKRELLERAQLSQERFERIVKLLESRSPLNSFFSLFKCKN